MQSRELEIIPLPKDFRTSPNQGAKFLEENLGIRFQVLPHEVRLDYVRNRIALLRHVPDARSEFGLDFLLGFSRASSVGGFCYPEWLTIFRWGEGGYSDWYEQEKAYLHENMHGFYYQADPARIRYARDNIKNLERQGDADTIASSDVEKYITHKFISEGFAEWGSAEAIRRAGLEIARTGELDRNNRCPASVEFHVKLLQNLTATMKRELEHAENAVPDYVSAFTFRGARRIRAVNKVDRTLRHFHYRIGELFVRESMEYLIVEGLDLPDAVSVFIQNVPERFDQLRNPLQFARQLSGDLIAKSEALQTRGK